VQVQINLSNTNTNICPNPNGDLGSDVNFWTSPNRSGDCLVAGTVFALLRSSSSAEAHHLSLTLIKPNLLNPKFQAWAEARLNGDKMQASHALERAIWEGGLVCARHAVMSTEAVPLSLRSVVEYPHGDENK